MHGINKLIQELCPNGVEFKCVWEVTAWDKKFNAVDSYKQKRTIKYHHFLAGDLDALAIDGGNIKLLTTNHTNVYTSSEMIGNDFSIGEIVAIPGGGNPIVQYYNGAFVSADNRIATSLDNQVLDNKFLYYYLQKELPRISSFYRGAGIQHPDMSKILDIRIPIPPLEVQLEIVRILDLFSKLVVDLTTELVARKKQYEYYKNVLLANDPSAKTMCVTDLCDDVFLGLTSKVDYVNEGGVPLVRANNMTTGVLSLDDVKYISIEQHQKLTKNHKAKNGDILVSKSGTLGVVCIVDVDIEFSIYESLICLQPNEQIYNRYLLHLLRSSKVQEAMLQKKVGNAIKHLNLLTFRNLLVPVPPLDKQKQIADILDRFDILCTDSNNGLPAEIEARQKQYEYYRDKLLTFKERVD